MSTVSTSNTTANTTASTNAALQEAAQSIISGSTGNSSMDVSTLVTALVNAKVAGQSSALASKQTSDNTKLSAIGTLKSALSALQASITNLANGKTLASYTATASGSGLTATAGVGAVAGSYQISVSQVAQAQTLSSGAFGATTQLGTGTLQVALGSQSMSINIDSSNNTLSGIASAINSASNNPGVSATVVTGKDGAHLVLRSTSTGASNTVSVSTSGVQNDQGLSSLGVSSSPALTSDPFSSTQQLGTGTMSVSIGGKSMDINVDSSNNTLSGIASAINGASDNPGVKASVVNTPGGAQLVLTSSDGSTNPVGVSLSNVSGDAGLSSLGSMSTTSSITSSGTPAWTQTQSAQDALFTVDGTEISSPSNTSTTAIAGVTLNLTAAALGTSSSSSSTTSTSNTQTLTIAPDTSSIATAINNFVSLYNTLNTTVGTLTSFDSSQSAGSQGGPLLGDTMTNTITSTLANIISGGVKNGNTTVNLASIGITLNADGSLSTDSDTLSNALSNSPGTVATLFNSTNGVAAQLNDKIANFTQTGGIIDTETTTINSDLSSIATQQSALTDYTTQLTNQYQAQFTALNTLMATMNNNSQYLTQLFGGTNSAGAMATNKS